MTSDIVPSAASCTFSVPFPGIELKVASKVFGQKFATGSSVTGNGDEIVIQGDVKDDIIDLLTEKWPEVRTLFIFITSTFLLSICMRRQCIVLR